MSVTLRELQDLLYFFTDNGKRLEDFCFGQTFHPLRPKGQLISKGLFGILNSSKKRTKKFDVTTMIHQVELVFLRIEDTKNTFRFELTLRTIENRFLENLSFSFVKERWTNLHAIYFSLLTD